MENFLLLLLFSKFCHMHIILHLNVTFGYCTLWQELSAEKSKVANVETRLSSQLNKREQEIIALQARMQASYQDHVAQTQTLNAKVCTCAQMSKCVFSFSYPAAGDPDAR